MHRTTPQFWMCFERLWLLGNEGAWQALVALAITAAFLYPVWRWASRCEYFYRYD